MWISNFKITFRGLPPTHSVFSACTDYNWVMVSEYFRIRKQTTWYAVAWSRWLIPWNSTTCRQVFLRLEVYVYTYWILSYFSGSPLWRYPPSTSPGGHPYAQAPWPIHAAISCGASPSTSGNDGSYDACIFVPPCSSSWCAAPRTPSPWTRGTWSANGTPLRNVRNAWLPSSRYIILSMTYRLLKDTVYDVY